MMEEVASRWFGFTVDERMAVHIGDGLEFVHEQTTGMKTPGENVVSILCNYEQNVIYVLFTN